MSASLFILRSSLLPTRACTYNVPNRRPKSLARHAWDLEDRLQTIEKLLKAAYPGLDIDDTRLELARGVSGNLQEADSTTITDKILAVEECDVSIVCYQAHSNLLISRFRSTVRLSLMLI